MKLPPRPVLSWRQIEQIGLDFCRGYKLDEREPPLDLEEIAELDLGMEISFRENIASSLGSPASIAFSKSTGRAIIYVDSYEHRKNSGYYRYSLAHEVAHWILHKDWIVSVSEQVDTVKSWKEAVMANSEDDYSWIESQAEELAAYLIAPAPLFDPAIRGILREKIISNSALVNIDADVILSYLANPVSEIFGTSYAAAQARIRKSQVWKDFKSGRPV